MLYTTPEDRAAYGFNPRNRVDHDQLAEHRTRDEFTWQLAVPTICQSEDAAMVDAFSTRRKGSTWWVWGTQPQRAIPERAELSAETAARWWPFSHFYWPCHAVARASYTLDVSMGEWERVETAGTITQYLSSSSVVVTLDEGHALTSGTYGLSWTPSSTRFERRGATCAVAGNELTISGGAGNSFQASHVGKTVRVTHWDATEAETTHCWRQGMLLRAWQALPEAEQPQYLASPTATAAVTAVAREVVSLSNVQFTTTWNAGTRPPGNTSSSYVFLGDLVYLRSLDPPQQQGTVATRDADGRGGTITFAGGHPWAVDDTVWFNAGSPYGVTYLVTDVGDTWIRVAADDFPIAAAGAGMPSVGATATVSPGGPWPGTQRGTTFGLASPRLSLLHPEPAADGTLGQLVATNRRPVQALQADQPAFEIDADHAAGWRVTFCLACDGEWDSGALVSDSPLAVGESIRVWLGSDCYVETTLYDQAANWWYYRHAVKNAAGKQLTRGWQDAVGRTAPGPASFTLDLQPAYHQAGWVLTHTWDLSVAVYRQVGAYVTATPLGEVSCERSTGDPVSLVRVETELIGDQAAFTYDSLDGDRATFTAGTRYMVPPAGETVAVRFDYLDPADAPLPAFPWQENSGVVVGSVHRVAHGTLATRTSDTAGSLTLDTPVTLEALPDGTHTVNLFWGDGLAGSKREGIEATISGGTMTFSGGDGDDLPEELDTTMHACETVTPYVPTWGGEFQLDMTATPPAVADVIRVAPGSTDTTQLREPTTYDSVWPWAYRVTIAGHPDAAVNGQYTLEWTYDENSDGEYAHFLYDGEDRVEYVRLFAYFAAYSLPAPGYANASLTPAREADLTLDVRVNLADLWAEYEHAYTSWTAGDLIAHATLSDAQQHVRTSDGPIEGHVFDAADMTAPLLSVSYTAHVSLYHARTDDTHGTLTAPDDARLMPPVDWEGWLTLTCNDGDDYAVYAQIRVTARNDGDADFEVLSFGGSPPYWRTALPPVGEVTAASLGTFLLDVSDLAPDLTITLECVDREP
jgi:hypothetical protein